jgi:hypothetical protein
MDDVCSFIYVSFKGISSFWGIYGMRYLFIDSMHNLWFRTQRPSIDVVPIWIQPICVGSKPNTATMISNLHIEVTGAINGFNTVAKTAQEVAGKLKKTKMAWK